jgi:hypothetical protein|tara:strand:- start:397 stop:1107 length:711 start_codon:yes stop_codon:yes gene_type:complete
MLNKITLWDNQTTDHSEEIRKYSSLNDLFLEYLRIEPHCFLHAGMFLKSFEEDLKNRTVLSIGLDPLKDIIFSTVKNISIDVIDIDEKSIFACNEMADKINTNNKLKFLEFNALDGQVYKKKYDVLILSQMDYIFTNHDYKKILLNASDSNIQTVLILTPSLYRFSFNPIILFETIFTYLLSLKYYLTKNASSTKTFRRRFSFFKKLISENYYFVGETNFKYPSGRITMIKLSLKK